MSFTNTHQFQPWLEALRSHEARLVGVFSVAPVAAQAGKRLGFKGGRYLIVSRQQARLRQSYIENGRIRFSRLRRLDFPASNGTSQDVCAQSASLPAYSARYPLLACRD